MFHSDISILSTDTEFHLTFFELGARAKVGFHASIHDGRQRRSIKPLREIHGRAVVILLAAILRLRGGFRTRSTTEEVDSHETERSCDTERAKKREAGADS